MITPRMNMLSRKLLSALNGQPDAAKGSLELIHTANWQPGQCMRLSLIRSLMLSLVAHIQILHVHVACSVACRLEFIHCQVTSAD